MPLSPDEPALPALVRPTVQDAIRRDIIAGVLTPGAGRYKVTVIARDADSRTASTTFFWNVWSF